MQESQFQEGFRKIGECFAEVHAGCSNEDLKKIYDKFEELKVEYKFNDFIEATYSTIMELLDKDKNEVKSMYENKSTFYLSFKINEFEIENCDKDVFINAFNDIFSGFENRDIIDFHIPEINPITTIPETTLPIITIPETTFLITTIPYITIPITRIPDTTFPKTTIPIPTILETTISVPTS